MSRFTSGETTNAEGFVKVDHAHVSGVSVITGGHGLRRFLADLSADGDGQVAIPTTLNSAGCDREKMKEMDIQWPDFLEQQFEIVQAYDRLGLEATLSCTPYDRGIEDVAGIASWAESNAVCYSNTWTSLDGEIEYWMVTQVELVAEVTRLKGLNVNVNWREYE